MKRFLLFLVTLIIAVCLGLIIKHDPGYMLLSYGTWTMEMPLWFGIIIIIAAFLIVYWIVRIIAYGVNIPERYNFWARRRRLHAAHELTNKGLIAVTEGNWTQAEKLLRRSATHTDTPLINYLAAARSAQELGGYDRRDAYLRQAHEVKPEAEIAVGLTQAQLQLEHRQYEHALATLRHLRDLVPHHKYVIKLLKKVYLALNDWHGLQKLLTELRKYKVMPRGKIDTLELKVYQKLLQCAGTQGITKLKEYWQNSVPKKLRYDPQLVAIYARELINNQDNELAEKILRETLKKQWDDQLILLYSDFISADAKKQLLTAEGFLKQHKNNANLMLTLGRLAVANQLWGKAKNYLQGSISVQSNVLAYRELAKLNEDLNERDEALACYRKAVELELGK